MLSNRILTAFFITLTASSFSFAQNPEAEYATDTAGVPIAGDLVSVLGSNLEPGFSTRQETDGTVYFPAPSVEMAAVAVQPENRTQASNVVVGSERYPARNQVYSPQRDGLPTLQQRRQLRAMPIEDRPNRPFHFYGNTVRRRLSR